MDTKNRLLVEATKQFSESGFDGASLSNIAGGVGVTKQTLLHHFGSKEELYAGVLKKISTRHLSVIDRVISEKCEPATQLEQIFGACFEDALEQEGQSHLLMRELLDNEGRAEKASVWYLKPVLETLTDMLLSTANWRGRTRDQAFSCVYQILGAINYFAVSQPTLEQMFGKERKASISVAFPEQLKALVRTAIIGDDASVT